MSITTDTTNRPLVVFGEDWGAHPSSTQHIIKELNQTRPIIWCNSIGLRKPKFTVQDIGRLLTKASAFLFKKKQPQQIPQKSKNFLVINPLVMPCADSWLSLTISRLILKCQLKSAYKKLAIQNPIVWTSLPTSVDYLDLFNDAPCVYYCGDDFSGLAGVDHEFVSKREQRLIARANYIFTASEKLKEKFPQEKAINIPHGVNFPLFSKTVKKPPEDLPTDKPIAGFYGSISTWLDQSLLVETIKSLPQWNFVFIGNIDCDIDNLTPFRNVHFIGAKSHDELPSYIQHWNVAMLPFIDNKQIQMCNPLKLREYLASGTPIVTTNFNALNGYRKYLQIASQSHSFHHAILFAYAEITSAVNFEEINTIQDLIQLTQIKNQRKASVYYESWQQRASDVQQYLCRC